MSADDISGAILAGGAGRRFGGMTKGNLLIKGRTIISRIMATTDGLFTEVMIVAAKPEEFSYLNQVRIIADVFRNAGPLGGIHAALKSSSSEAVFIYASDMPFVDREITISLIDEYRRMRCEVLIPRTGSLIEPLHAIYCRSVIGELEKYIARGESLAVRDFLNKVRTEYFDLPETDDIMKSFSNINSRSDLTRIADKS